jgi:phosphate transport system substrate-binding protein
MIHDEDFLKRTACALRSFLPRLALVTALLAVATCVAGCSTGRARVQETGATATAIIQNKGSDTLVNLALAWAERYMGQHPDVRISVTGGGSGTGIAAMINGTVDIANASREVKPEEIAAAKKNGNDPVQFVVARDAIAVVVNPHNPVSRLTLEQISGMYTGRITNWQQVGGDNRPIVLLSRESNSAPTSIS